MWEGRNDQGSTPKLPPLTNQKVMMRLNGAAVKMGRVSADPAAGVAQARVTIPDTTAPGKILLTIGIAQAAEVTVIPK